MNKKLILGTIFLIFILLIPKVIFATMGAITNVINHNEKLCGDFWLGDEYRFYELPPGWVNLDARVHYLFVTHNTPFGDCNFQVIPVDTVHFKLPLDYYQNCCEKLGFKYIDYNLITYNKDSIITIDNRNLNCIYETNNNSLIINTTTNECSKGGNMDLYDINYNSRTYNPTEAKQNCQFTDSNWEMYYTDYPINYEKTIYSVFLIKDSNTSDTECNSVEISDGNCCKKLGYTYIGSVNGYYDMYSKKNQDYDNIFKNYFFYGMIPVIVVIALIVVFRKKIFKKK